MTRTASVALTLLFVPLLLPLSASAAVDCSTLPGTHVATQDDVDKGLATAAGASCVDDDFSSRQNGGCDYNPYQVLESQYRGGGPNQCNPNGVQITPRENMTAGIDPALACRLTKLFKAANDRGCQAKITSAYRSEGTQQCMCGAGGSGCAPAGRSCHQRGLAVDVGSSCIGWLRMAAPQFQLVFPYYGDHIQCAEHPGASVNSCNRPCNGGVVINPDLSRFPLPSQVPDTYYRPPGSSFPGDDRLRQLLGQPPPPPSYGAQSVGGNLPTATTPTQTTTTQTPPSTDSINTTAYPAGTCAPQTRCMQSDGNIYYRATTCVDQLYQKCQSGCTGLVCNATSTSSGSSNAGDLFGKSTTTSQNPNTTVSGHASSTFDLIDFFANGPLFQPVDIGKAVPIDISQTIKDAGNASMLGPAQSTAAQTSAPPPLSPYGPTPQQTFTSGDLANSPAYVAWPQSTFDATLASMKAALLRALQYLQPFGGIHARQEQMIE